MDKRDFWGTMAMIALGLFLLPGCGGVQKAYMKEVLATVENGIKDKEPCNITCGKLKVIVQHYKNVE